MDKLNFKKMMLAGIASGLALGCQVQAADTSSPAKTEVATKMITADELVAQLSDKAKAMYNELSAEGKDLALAMANQSCKGKNGCKGQNSCKSQANSCAGAGGCKGTAVGKFKDGDQAVKVASMKDKRDNAR